MAGIADHITCPTLVLEAENDQFFKDSRSVCSTS